MRNYSQKKKKKLKLINALFFGTHNKELHINQILQ